MEIFMGLLIKILNQKFSNKYNSLCKFNIKQYKKGKKEFLVK
jgi:hypothetical protein